jgi:hypothetical protein
VDVDGISISDAGWQKWVIAFAVATNRDVRTTLYEEWPLLIRKVMDFTPPFKTRAAYKGDANVNANHASDFSVGRKAVAFDIYKTMRPFDPKDIHSASMRRIVEEKDLAAFNIVAARSQNPLMRGLFAIPFDPSEHLRQRNARGRVLGRDRRRVVLGDDAERLKVYVTSIQSRVGFAKSGWLKALLLTGGDAPNYVSRHGTGGGDVIDDHADEENPSITAINRTPWAIRKDEGERILADARASRMESIITKTKQAVLRAADEASAG